MYPLLSELKSLYILVLLSGYLFSNPYINELFKEKHSIVFEVKTYNLPSNENIVLYGAKNKRYINDKLYWGEAGYGAISGRRGGYLEGGFIVGYQNFKDKTLNLDYRLFMGAGGGGSAPQGGGLIINLTLGLSYNLSEKWLLSLETGYIKFLNGNINSPTFGISINRNYWNLSIND